MDAHTELLFVCVFYTINCACVFVRIPNKMNCRNVYMPSYSGSRSQSVAPRVRLCERTTEACAHRNTVAV